MRILCPLCGTRGIEEFTYSGDASVTRPDPSETDLDAWYDFVYTRENPKGPHKELWHHIHGCRAWVVVERDTLTHEVFGAELARDRRSPGAGEGKGE